MNKKTGLWIVLDLIFLIIFNAIFFIAGGTEHKTSVWISYGFIHFAYFMLILTPFLIRKGKSSAVFGFSLYSISSFYFILELITGVIFILFSADSYKTALLVQLCIAGLYGIILISNLLVNERTAEAEEKRQYDISYVKDGSAKLKVLLDNVRDKDLQKKVERVYDALYSSPVKSRPEIAQMENRILQSINELEDAVEVENRDVIISLTQALLAAVNERNMRLKTLN